jgi:Zn-dependent metalloprotease
MKKILLMISVFTVLSAFGNRNATVLSGKRAEEKIANSELVRLKHFTSIPNYVKFREGKELPLEKLGTWLNQFYSSDVNNGIKLIRKEAGSLGMTHYRYQQTVNDVPVELSAFIAHVKNGKIYAVNGNLFSDIDASSSISLTEMGALNIALSYINADTYKWEIQKEEQQLKSETDNPDATYFPKGELVWMNEGGIVEASMKLVYKFNIYAQKPFSRREIFIDASNGDVIWEQNKIHDADVTGNASTLYSGTQTIVCDDASGPFRLRESGRGNGIRTYSNGNTTNYSTADITNPTANWTTPDAALDAHWGSEMTYDYFLNVHGRNSIDGNGMILVSHVHHDDQYSNAFWDGQRMTYGDGNGNNTPFTALDIAGHEISHGVTERTAGLIYQDESGALNESFSDIFGISVEFINRPAVADWVLGDDLGFVVRNMADPNSEGDPHTRNGNNWAPLGGADNGGVHSNSGVQNFWFVLLTDGGSGTNDNGDNYTVNSIGLNIAGAVAFRNLTVYLTQSSNYDDARFYAIRSAVDLYGGCSNEVQEVTNAWYAVGVGPEYVDYTLSDFEAPIDSSCAVPFTASFNNLSINGSTYLWDFGDGNTSTQTNPFNTYTTAGNYSVSLTVNGDPGCGNDTTIKVDFIVLDAALPCKINLPTSGTATQQTSCTGTVYDSGGEASNYGADEDAQITIAPIGAATIDLNFVFFDIEPGSNNNCDFDYINIYDGPTTGSALIGKYCNDNIPTTISSSTGAITLLFHSDGGLEQAGFQMDWTCNLASQAPVADFTNNVDTTCTGEIFFTDISTNAPNDWLWNFGDGNTSTLKNPVHTYMANGLYSVELIAINSIGNNSVIKTDLIYVNYPTSPTVIEDTVCVNSTATLMANGSGVLNWYSVATAGSIINTGTTYVTPNLSTSTTYYVEDVIVAPSLSLGKLDDSGSGADFNNQQHLFFDVYSPIEIVDVQVYTATAGLRVVELRNSFGSVQGTKVVNLTGAGQQTVTLNFMVEPGTDYELGLATNSPNIELYRSNGGISYPYTLNDLASITHSSANQNGGLDHYYFFYNWNVKEGDCISLRTPVSASVDVCTGVDYVNDNSKVVTFINGNGYLELTLLNYEGTYNLSIVNSLGQVVKETEINVNTSNQSEKLNINNLSKGLYYVNLFNANNNYTSKIVK